MICNKPDFSSMQTAIDVLKRGGIAILPTDTVYGFSGIAKQKFGTEEKIRRIKGREEGKPFIQLISSAEELRKYTNDRIPEKLLDFWPGPLTIIVNDNRKPFGTTAFRCPGDEWLRGMIRGCGFPVFSTSVNRSGSPALLTADEIVSEFESDVDLIVLDGDSKDSVPSTIVSVTDGKMKVVRQGKIFLDFV